MQTTNTEVWLIFSVHDINLVYDIVRRRLFLVLKICIYSPRIDYVCIFLVFVMHLIKGIKLYASNYLYMVRSMHLSLSIAFYAYLLINLILNDSNDWSTWPEWVCPCRKHFLLFPDNLRYCKAFDSVDFNCIPKTFQIFNYRQWIRIIYNERKAALLTMALFLNVLQ